MLIGLAETLATFATRPKFKRRSRALDSEAAISSATMSNTSLIAKKVIVNTTRFDCALAFVFLNNICFINMLISHYTRTVLWGFFSLTYSIPSISSDAGSAKRGRPNRNTLRREPLPATTRRTKAVRKTRMCLNMSSHRMRPQIPAL